MQQVQGIGVRYHVNNEEFHFIDSQELEIVHADEIQDTA